MKIMWDEPFVNNTNEERIKNEREGDRGLKEDFNIERILEDPNTPEDVKLALSFEKFKPVERIKVGDYEFFLTPVVKNFDRSGAVGYVLGNDNIAQLRVFWKSKSGGGWRINAPNKVQTLSKGLTDDNGVYRHYTKETKPHEDIVGLLDSLPFVEKSDDSSSSYNDYRILRDKNKNNYNLEKYIEETVPEIYSDRREWFLQRPIIPNQLYDSNWYLDSTILRGQIFSQEELNMNDVRNIRYPEKLLPDFTQEPEKVYYQTHTLYSEVDENTKHLKKDIMVEVYSSIINKKNGDEKIFWHMASTKSGKVWVDRIVTELSKINSFGIYDRVIDFGIFDLKPIDYKKQVKKIPSEYKTDCESGRDYFDDYDDITDFLAELLPIKLYKENRIKNK